MADRRTVLVADDEVALRELLRPYLEAEGLAVEEVDTGAGALRALSDGRVDVGVIDVMLPDLDGFEVVRRARESTDVPIILLTARREEGHRVAGLRIGADDYVVKPFSVPELVARVITQLRRAAGGSPERPVRWGSIEIDPSARRATVGDREIDLTRREYDLLLALVENPGRVLERPTLLRTVWGTPYVSERTVDVHIAGLRRKLGAALKISALRGVGYRLEPP